MFTTTPPAYEYRTREQLRSHFDIERELANRLRHSTREERASLYSAVYDELFRRVPDHPQLTRVLDSSHVQEIVREKLALLRRFLAADTVFLELGAGDCEVAAAVARYVHQAYGLDVADVVSRGLTLPSNFRFLHSTGTDIPLPTGSVTLAYAYQLLEHIHPDDALEQLRNVYEVLTPGGRYICITPNRLTGPHDISRYFRTEAAGLHLKEYTISEVADIFCRAGFSIVQVYPGVRQRYACMPVMPVTVLESMIASLPRQIGRILAYVPVIHNLLLSAVVATKPGPR